MDLPLALSLVGLALVDSINTGTIYAVIVLLLTARRPARTGWAYMVGAAGSFLALTLLLFFGVSFAAETFETITDWMRRGIFTVLTIVLLVLGIRRLKTRKRREFKLPAWINAWTALPLGMLATLGDLPNAFPMFLAVERLVDNAVPAPIAVVTLVIYTFIYALPTLVILILGLVYGEQMRNRLQTVYNRYATGDVQASWKVASMFFAGAGLAVVILILIW